MTDINWEERDALIKDIQCTIKKMNQSTRWRFASLLRAVARALTKGSNADIVQEFMRVEDFMTEFQLAEGVTDAAG